MTESILVVAAHPDDEVLGAGGTIARWSDEGHSIHLLFMADGEGARSVSENMILESGCIEQRSAAAHKACSILGCASINMLELPDNRLDSFELLDIVKRIEGVIEKTKPRKVLTHHCGDVNIDHRVVHNAVISACRPQPECSVKELLFFEVCSSTEWNPPGSSKPFLPNYFVDISTTLDKKMEALQSYLKELREFPHSRSMRAVESLARWRGAMVGVEAAESFILGRKII